MRNNILEILHQVINDFNSKWQGHSEKNLGVSEYADRIMSLLSMPTMPQDNKTPMKTQDEFANIQNERFQHWRNFRTSAINEMFENKGKDGIYPTTEFFNKIDEFVLKTLAAGGLLSPEPVKTEPNKTPMTNQEILIELKLRKENQLLIKALDMARASEREAVKIASGKTECAAPREAVQPTWEAEPNLYEKVINAIGHSDLNVCHTGDLDQETKDLAIEICKIFEAERHPLLTAKGKLIGDQFSMAWGSKTDYFNHRYGTFMEMKAWVEEQFFLALASQEKRHKEELDGYLKVADKTGKLIYLKLHEQSENHRKELEEFAEFVLINRYICVEKKPGLYLRPGEYRKELTIPDLYSKFKKQNQQQEKK